jgi:hypothetical protein
MTNRASLFLRLGLAFVFAFAGISAILNPTAWIGFVPNIVELVIAKESFLILHDIINLSLAVWLVSGKKTYWAAIGSCIMLAGIILGNLGALIITFRDIGLFMAAVALAVMSKNQ